MIVGLYEDARGSYYLKLDDGNFLVTDYWSNGNYIDEKTLTTIWKRDFRDELNAMGINRNGSRQETGQVEQQTLDTRTPTAP